jgi:hypothetical protein
MTNDAADPSRADSSPIVAGKEVEERGLVGYCNLLYNYLVRG